MQTAVLTFDIQKSIRLALVASARSRSHRIDQCRIYSGDRLRLTYGMQMSGSYRGQLSSALNTPSHDSLPRPHPGDFPSMVGLGGITVAR